MYAHLYPPKGLVVKKFHGPSNSQDFEDSSLLLLKPDRFGHLTVETGEGDFQVKDTKDFLKLFPSKYNWTFSALNEIDCAFKVFTKYQLIDLAMYGRLKFDEWELYWILGTGKIRLQKGKDTRSSRFLLNPSGYFEKNTTVKTLEDLKALIDKVLTLNSVLSVNPISPASTVKDLVLAGNSKEFELFNHLTQEDLKFIHTTYIGPRMESKFLGTIDHAENIDMVKAYLRALGRCPSLSKWNIGRIERGERFYPQAHPGSSYEIIATVPSSYKDFPPLPLRQSHIKYPHGTFQTQVSKPFIDLIIEAGDIPFKIIRSFQPIPLNGKMVYPFKELADQIELFEDTFSAQLKPLNLKALHYSLQGHMLHFHRVLNPDDPRAPIFYETSQDYNPINACAIQSMVACEIWKLARTRETEAIRVDALTGYDLEVPEGFRKEETGLMTFLTPSLKDKPGKTTYRRLIERDRDMPFTRVNFPVRNSIKSSCYNPARIGRLKDQTVEIFPLGGSRKIERIRRMGLLLEGKILSTIPTVEEELPRQEGETYWLDKYLQLFPQTQT